MRDMTWGELKALVEAAGVQDSDTIDWVDLSHPTVRTDGTTPVEVFVDAKRHTVVVY